MHPALDLRQALRLGAALLLLVACLSAQEIDPALDALKKEAANLQKAENGQIKTSNSFQNALVNWIESRLPADKAALDTDFIGLQWRLEQELEAAELRGYGHDYAGEFGLTRPAHDPEGLLLTVEGKSRLYTYEGQSRVRVLAAEGSIVISPADERGDHLLLVTQEQRPRYRYDLYRLSGAALQHILASNPLVAAASTPEVELRTSEFLIEYTGDTGNLMFPDRTHLLRYRIGRQSSVRVDPVAYDPADFVDEWLIAPWSDMESRSVSTNRVRLAEMHQLLSGKAGIGSPQSCAEGTGRWQISLRFAQKLYFFLVQQTAPHGFVMEEIDDSPFQGCTEKPKHVAPDSRIQRVMAEAAHAHAADSDMEKSLETIVPLADALRDWIESHLPPNLQTLEASYVGLQWTLRAELERAHLPEPSDEHPAGGVGISIERFPEYPNGLVITTDLSVACGGDSTVYLYTFSASGWTRILTDHEDEGSGTGASVEISRPDEQGNPLLLVRRDPVHCASFWTALGYSLYRLNGANATQVLSQWHDLYMQSEAIHLQPNGLLIELNSWSIDAGFSRRYVLRYAIDANSAKRIEPIGFSPLLFVEEWLTLPWQEVETYSLEEVRPQLKKWHSVIPGADGSVLSTESGVESRCSERPGYWQVNFTLTFSRLNKEEEETVYFLVQERGRHLFTMVNISQNPFKGCPRRDQ